MKRAGCLSALICLAVLCLAACQPLSPAEETPPKPRELTVLDQLAYRLTGVAYGTHHVYIFDELIGTEERGYDLKIESTREYQARGEIVLLEDAQGSFRSAAFSGDVVPLLADEEGRGVFASCVMTVLEELGVSIRDCISVREDMVVAMFEELWESFSPINARLLYAGGYEIRVDAVNTAGDWRLVVTVSPWEQEPPYPEGEVILIGQSEESE